MEDSSLDTVIKRYAIVIELVTGMTAVAFLVYILRSMLVSGETMPMHDNVVWGYPTFQFFAENMINGHYPFWNPFSHSGEPYYPIILQRMFLDPVVLIVIYIGKFFTDDIVMLFSWHHFVRCMVMVFGVYIVFRPMARHPFIRLTLIPVLLYSSFILASFRQNSFVELFVWLPYITLFFLRIVYYRNYGWYNWLAFAGLVGLNWQSYYFTGYWIFLLFILLGIVFFRRDLLRELFMSKGVMLRLAGASAIILLMMVPNIVLMQEADKYTFPARMINVSYLEGVPRYAPLAHEGKPGDIVKGTVMPYRVISHTGTPSTIWDFIQIISPGGNGYLGWPGWQSWGDIRESYIYIGILPWAIALLGMVAGVHDLKKVWLLILFGFGLLLLGPAGGLHRLMYYVYPPLWFIRHTSLFVLYFVFPLLYFYVLGFNHIFATWGGHLFPRNTEDNSMFWFVNIVYRTRSRMARYIGISSFNKIGYIIYPIEIILTIAFTACMIASVDWMTKLVYPASDYLFVYIISIIGIGWLIRKVIGKRGIYIGLLVSHVVIVLLFNPDIFKFLTHIILVLGIPVLLYLILKVYVVRAQRNFVTIIMLAIFAVSLCGDLIYSLKQSSYVYSIQKHLGLVDANINTTVQKPYLPRQRVLSPEQLSSANDQNLRFLPSVYRRPYVFSALFEIENKPDDFEYALKSKRWNSFLLLNKYYELINSGIPPMAMKEMFAVGKPPFQFRKGAVIADDGESYECLKQMGPEGSVQFLKDYVFIDRHSDHSLIGTGIPAEGYAQVDQVAFAAGSYKDGEDEGQDDKFLYVIKRYAYNSFDMGVYAYQAGILYWTDGYDKWWRAYINGIEVPLYRANVNFKAVALPEGMSIVKFVYSPTLFKLALSLFYGVFTISMAAALGIFSGAERYRKKGS